MINGKPEIAGFSQIIEEKNALELEQYEVSRSPSVCNGLFIII